VSTPPQNHRNLPSREIAYHYAAAMHFAQRFERDLRSILWTADYHGWIDAIPLTADQVRRFKGFEGFIDKSACGLLLEKLRGTGTIKATKEAWRTFNRACEHRNTLAHSFLADQAFESLSPKKEKAIIHKIQRLALEIYKALLLSCDLRRQVDAMSDKEHELSRKIMKDLAGVDNYQAPNRSYDTRQRRKPKKGGA
jgi:hypothetical protein